MNLKKILAPLATVGIMGFVFAAYLNIPLVFGAVTTTIVGWNVPSGTTFGHGLVVLILPLATMGLFAALPMIVDQRGKIVVTMALIGLTIGGIVGMMSLSSVSATDVSLAFVVVSGMYLVLWFWKGGQ